MEKVAEFFIDILIKRWIIRVIGIQVRKFFFNVIGKKVTLEDLRGKDDDIASQFVQDLYNAFVGVLVLFVFLFLLAFFYSLFST